MVEHSYPDTPDAFHPDKNLPDCMMPDGGECCAGHAALVEDWRKQRREIERLRGVAQAPGDDPQITISVLQMLSPTEQADIDFLLNSLVDPNVDPTFNRGVVAGFRRQLINVAAAEATLLALSSAPAQQAVGCGVDRIADIISDYYDEDDSGRWRKCAEHIASVVSSTDAQAPLTGAMIEAGARALCLAQFGDEATHGEARCCQVGGKDGCCLHEVRKDALACLEAALSTLSSTTHEAPPGGQAMDEAAADNFGLTVDDLGEDEHDPGCQSGDFGPCDCSLSSTDRVTLPGHDETMANLDALTIGGTNFCGHGVMAATCTICHMWSQVSSPDKSGAA